MTQAWFIELLKDYCENEPRCTDYRKYALARFILRWLQDHPSPTNFIYWLPVQLESAFLKLRSDDKEVQGYKDEILRAFEGYIPDLRIVRDSAKRDLLSLIREIIRDVLREDWDHVSDIIWCYLCSDELVILRALRCLMMEHGSLISRLFRADPIVFAPIGLRDGISFEWTTMIDRTVFSFRWNDSKVYFYWKQDQNIGSYEVRLLPIDADFTSAIFMIREAALRLPEIAEKLLQSQK